MSTPIDRSGTYRGFASELAVNETKNGYPQLVIQFRASEYFDENAEFVEKPDWVNWAEYEADIVVYFVLFGAKGKCLNFEQVQKAFGWDGVSFFGLESGDWSNTVFQLRLEEEEYDGVTRLKGKWIDAHDATPGGQGLQKLDAPALAALDAKYASQMTGKKVTPKKAPKGKPVAPPKVKATPKPKLKVEPKPKPEPEAEKPKAEKPQAEAPVRATRGKDKNKDTPKDWPAACSHDVAWQKVCELKMASVTDDELSAAWLDSVDVIAGPDVDVDDVTEEQWGRIRDKVLEIVPHHPF